MASFTDQKQRIATQEDVNAPWCGERRKDRTNFRCHLCGHVFKVGDKWRWVCATPRDCPHHHNFLTCEACDGPDVRQRMEAHALHIRKVGWWAFENTPKVEAP